MDPWIICGGWMVGREFVSRDVRTQEQWKIYLCAAIIELGSIGTGLQSTYTVGDTYLGI